MSTSYKGFSSEKISTVFHLQVASSCLPPSVGGSDVDVVPVFMKGKVSLTLKKDFEAECSTTSPLFCVEREQIEALVFVAQTLLVRGLALPVQSLKEDKSRHAWGLSLTGFINLPLKESSCPPSTRPGRPSSTELNARLLLGIICTWHLDLEFDDQYQVEERRLCMCAREISSWKLRRCCWAATKILVKARDLENQELEDSSRQWTLTLHPKHKKLRSLIALEVIELTIP
ncbi:hypothetical protein AAC387_Pa03g4589 [Persea americana]